MKGNDCKTGEKGGRYEKKSMQKLANFKKKRRNGRKEWMEEIKKGKQ